MNKYTFLHLAAFEFFNAIKVIAGAFVKASHVIALLFACTPALAVERVENIFIVAFFIAIGVIPWMATLSLVNVQKICGRSRPQSEAVQVVTRWTQRPDINTEKS